MTDNDVKKSIEWHLNNETNCDECLYKDFKYTNGNCVGKMLKDALNLIKRLQEQDKKNENIIRLADKTIEKQQAEIEDVNVYCENLEYSPSHLLNELSTAKKTAKTEAIKEFERKIKAHAYYIDVPKEHRVVDEDDIDTVLKEVTESVNYAENKTRCCHRNHKEHHIASCAQCIFIYMAYCPCLLNNNVNCKYCNGKPDNYSIIRKYTNKLPVEQKNGK